MGIECHWLQRCYLSLINQLKQILMKKTITLLSMFLGISVILNAQEPCATGRYSTEIFPTVTTTTDIVYGSNTSFNGATTSLKLDFYEGTGDSETERPLIIWAHGGSFLGGSKTDNDVATLSQEFAKRGYVCASIDYRLGFFPIDSANAVKAVVRAVQDMKAAIRFFYKDRADGTNLYKIDTNNIFVGGSSAGAITALHTTYLDRDCEIAGYLNASQLATLGGLEGNSGNSSYSMKVNGVVNLCGALASYGWFEAGDLPMCSLHGTADATVKYNRGVVNPGVPLMYLDGSRMLHEQAQSISVQSNFYTFHGAPHVPYLPANAAGMAYMDTTVNFVRDYLIDRLGCTDAALQAPNAPAQTATLYTTTYCLPGAGIGELDNELGFNVYPNPSNGDMTIQLQENEKVTIQLIDFSGRVMLSETSQNSTFLLQRGSLNNGLYLLRIFNESGKSTTKPVLFN